MTLDEEYYEARKEDRKKNEKTIARADFVFKQQALNKLGRKVQRFVPSTLGGQMKNKGFTLIETIVTVVVIGIISVVVIGKIMGAQDAATTVACLANIDAFATEINLLAPTGPAPTQDQVREHIKWENGRYDNYWYIPNNSDSNSGHGNDLDGCDEENPGASLPGRECLPMRFIIVCNHETHGNNSDAKYVFHLGGGMPPQIVAYNEFRHTYLQDAKWWPREDPGFDNWIGWVPKK